MATERLPMRKIREIFRLKWVEKRSNREVSSALGVSVGKVSQVVRQGERAELTWERIEALDEGQLEAAVYGKVRRREQTPLPEPATGPRFG